MGLHQLFWDLFSDGNGDPQQHDFLFREEIAAEQLQNPGRRRGDPLYYILSKQPPKDDNPLFAVETKPYQPQLRVGDRLAFKLRVNAVVTRNSKRERKQRLLDQASDPQIEVWRAQIEAGPYRQKLEQRLSHTNLLEWALKTTQTAAVAAWWQRQGMRHGFEVARNKWGEEILEQAAYHRHHLPEKGKRAGFNSLDLTGEVVVSDVEPFRRLLRQGTGPAKAFGCGLMLVLRLR